MQTILDEELPSSRLAGLLKHFSQIEDGRQSWRVAFSGGNVAASDLRNNRRLHDVDEIVAWGSITWIFYDGRAISFWDPVCPLVADVGQPSRPAFGGFVSRAGSRNSGPPA